MQQEEELLSVADEAQAFACPACARRCHFVAAGGGPHQCPACGAHACLFCAEVAPCADTNRAHVRACPANPNPGALVASSQQLRALRIPEVKRAVLAHCCAQKRLKAPPRACAQVQRHFGFSLSHLLISHAQLSSLVRHSDSHSAA